MRSAWSIRRATSSLKLRASTSSQKNVVLIVSIDDSCQHVVSCHNSFVSYSGYLKAAAFGEGRRFSLGAYPFGLGRRDLGAVDGAMVVVFVEYAQDLVATGDVQ